MKKIIPLLIFVVLATVSYFGVRTFASNTAEEQINIAIEKASEFAAIKYENVDVEPISQNVTMDNVVIVPKGGNNEIKVNQIIVSEIDGQTQQGEIPNRLAMTLKGLQINTENLENDMVIFEDLGYTEDLLIDLDIDYNYNERQKDLEINKLALNIDEMFRINFDVHLSGITIDPNNMENLLFGLAFSSLHNATLEYDDNSFAERMMKSTAEDDNMTVDELKEELSEGLENMLQSKDNQFITNTIETLQKFIKNPEDIVMSATPSTPISLGSLGMYRNNPSKIIEELNLKVE